MENYYDSAASTTTTSLDSPRDSEEKCFGEPFITSSSLSSDDSRDHTETIYRFEWHQQKAASGDLCVEYLPDKRLKEPPSKQKGIASCVRKCAFYMFFAGFAFILAGVVCAFIMKPIVEDQILLHLPIAEGSKSFKDWKDPPAHPLLFMRFFNFTNVEDFMAGRAKPNLSEIGPYSYRQNLHKTDIEFHRNKTEVSFRMKREYFFAPEISKGSEDDIIVVPNIPLFGAMKKMRDETAFAKSVFRSLLEGYDFAVDTRPFLVMTVKQFLWGYPSVLLSMERAQSKDCHGTGSKGSTTNEDIGNGDWADFGLFHDEEKPRKDSFSLSDHCDIAPGNLVQMGLFVGRNGTAVDLRKIKTGVDDLRHQGQTVEWHGKSTVDYWVDTAGNDCNKVSGNDPGNLPLDVKHFDELTSYIGQLCRELKFRFVKKVRVGRDKEFDTLRFIPLENSFDDPTAEPSNLCYCLTDPCLPSGLLDISGCQKGSPIYMSWPHFLHGDDILLEGVTGMKPDPEKHSFTIDIIPKYGISMSALARFQFVILIEKNSGFGYFDNIKQDKVYLPFGWLEEGVVGPSEIVAEKMTYLLELPNRVKHLVSLGTVGFGLCLLVPELIFWICSCKNKAWKTTAARERRL